MSIPDNVIDEFDDFELCPDCVGEGFVLTCCDDICHGLGYCIHSDGEAICTTCWGEGYIIKRKDLLSKDIGK